MKRLLGVGMSVRVGCEGEEGCGPTRDQAALQAATLMLAAVWALPFTAIQRHGGVVAILADAY